MLRYLLVYILFILTSVIEVLTKKKVLLLFLFCFVYLMLLAGLRGDSGIDTKNYLEFFGDATSKNASSYNLDYGFVYFSAIIKVIYDNPVFYFIVIATLAIGLKMYVVWKLSPLPIITSAILFGTYFLPLETNQIRQGIALGFTLLAVLYRVRNKKVYFFASILIGSCFHISAVLFTVIWFLKRKITSAYLLGIVRLSFFFVFISTEFLITNIVGFGLFWNEFMYAKLINYASKMEPVGFSPIQLWYILSTLFFFYFRKFVKSEIFDFLLNIFVLGIALNFFLNSFSYMLRITYYFLAVEVLLLGIALYHSRHFLNRLTILIVVFLLIFFKNYSYYFENIDVYK